MSALLRQMMQDSPSLLLPLTETSGTTAKDVSGSGINGTYTSMAGVGTRTTPLGPGPDFDGSTSYVTVPDNNLLSPHAGSTGLMSLEAWFVADVVPSVDVSRRRLVSKFGPGQYEYEIGIIFANSWATHPTLFSVIYLASGSLVTIAPNSTYAGATQPSAGVLHQSVMTYDAAAMVQNFYLDGALVMSANTNLNPGNYSSNGTASFEIGRTSDNSATPWDGVIQYVGLYPTVISATRIKSHYLAGIRGGVSY